MSIESVTLSNHLILWCPLLLPSILPRIRIFFSELTVCIRWPKYWSLSFSISPSNEYLGLISFRISLMALSIDKGVVFYCPYSRVNFNQCELIKKCQVVVWNVSLRFPWPQRPHLLFWSPVTSHRKFRGHCCICALGLFAFVLKMVKSYHDQLSFPSRFDRTFEHELLLVWYIYAESPWRTKTL